jgi:hypothetical protein
VYLSTAALSWDVQTNVSITYDKAAVLKDIKRSLMAEIGLIFMKLAHNIR